jgi:hypothetical protein
MSQEKRPKTKYRPESYPEPTMEEPDEETLAEWFLDSVCAATDGCEPVEHDGFCEHGYPSWMLYLGLI